MSSASLRAYLIKNYASSPSSNKKLKKKKRKKKKKDSVLGDQRPVSIPRSNVVDPADDEITAMPNLNDGSGWNQSPNPNHSILASNGKRKRDHEEAESHRSTSTNRIRTVRYDTDSDDDDDSDIEVSRRKSDSDSDLEVDRKPMSSMKPEYAVDSDSDIEVTRRSTDSVKKEEKGNNTQNDNQTVYRNEKGRRITKEEYNAMKRKKGKKEEEEMEWAGGLVQKYESFESQVIAQRQRFNQLARYKDDAEMNVDLQNEHRAEDPLNQMDGYEQIEEIQRNRGNGETSGRPMYRGKPWVNRYGILPGYRWDGVDRSNGFEQKKLLHQSRNKDLKKKRYKWANEDM